MKSKRNLSLFIFFLGFVIAFYPLASRTYYDYVSRQQTDILHQNIQQKEEKDFLHEKQLAYNQSQFTDLAEIEMANVGFAEENKSEFDPHDPAIIGSLSIPKIDLNYIIYDGASDDHLSKGLARLKGTSYPVGGINTNSVIAGHNGWIDAVFFSRLDELVEGDKIYVQNQAEVLTYEVYDFAVIEPHDVPALAIIPGQDTLTLLTCTSPPPGTHRYLVYAKRIPNDENSQSLSLSPTQDDSFNFELWLSRYGLPLIILILGILLAYFIFFKKRGKENEE